MVVVIVFPPGGLSRSVACARYPYVDHRRLGFLVKGLAVVAVIQQPKQDGPLRRPGEGSGPPASEDRAAARKAPKVLRVLTVRVPCPAAGRLYGRDPEESHSGGYFDCVGGLTERARRVTSLLFGDAHSYVKALFKRSDKERLSVIRGQIVHGTLSLTDRDDELLVRSRLPEIAEIAREFLASLALGLRVGDRVPNWSGHYKAGFSMADPRSVMNC